MKIRIEEEEIFVKPVAEPLSLAGYYEGQAFIRGRAVIRGEVVVFEQKVVLLFHPDNGTGPE